MEREIEVDGQLAPAQQRLDAVVHALVDAVPVWDGGVCRWSESVYARLRQALRGRQGAGGVRLVAGSRAPCSIAALDLTVAVDSCAERWEPDGKGTVDRLRRLVDRGWRPQDVAAMDAISGQLERWVVEASQLLDDETTAVSLRMPCPACGSRYSYRRSSGGETVRSDALRVSEHGAECLACRANWPPEEFHWLARLLGCEELPA
ncbi:MAG: hypothetical protein K0U78_21405 [Actinomycetia bacterium]|nr:hypothetical protein [Actinomycetes bacterium]